MIDREAQKKTLISGILPNAEQDYAVTESMGPHHGPHAGAPLLSRRGDHPAAAAHDSGRRRASTRA